MGGREGTGEEKVKGVPGEFSTEFYNYFMPLVCEWLSIINYLLGLGRALEVTRRGRRCRQRKTESGREREGEKVGWR